MRTPRTIDLSLPGRPHLTSRPANGWLSFGGYQHFRAGNALVLGRSRYTPRGLIAVALGIRHVAGRTLVRYRMGGLFDAFQELDITAQVPAKSRARAPRSRLENSHDLSVTGGHGMDFSGSKDFTLASGVSAHFGYDFAPAVWFTLTLHQDSLGFPNGYYVHLAGDADTTINAGVTAGLSWSGSLPLSWASELGAFDLGPIVVVPVLNANLTFSASVQANVSLTATTHLASHVGFNLQNGSSWADDQNGFGSPSLSFAPAVNVSASASAQAQLKLTLLVDAVAGPDVEADAGLTATLSPGSNPVWQVVASAGLKVGVDFNALNNKVVQTILHFINIPTNPSWSLWSWNHTWQANGPSGGSGSSGSGGSQSGSPPSNTALSQGQGSINISPCLNMRSGPSTGDGLVTCVSSGAVITVQCVATGSAVTGPYGTSSLWDYTNWNGHSGYVSDALVFTGTNSAVAGTCGSSPAPVPPSSGNTGTINTSVCLKLRQGPSTSAGQVGCVPPQTVITIDCTAYGDSVTGPYGASTLWDHTDYGGAAGFVSDAWVYTGTPNPVASACGGGGGSQTGSGTIVADPCLHLRSGPDTSAASLACIPKGTSVTIYCTTSGPAQTGPYGTSSVWDRTVYGGATGYVSDAWVYTGTNNPVAGAC